MDGRRLDNDHRSRRIVGEPRIREPGYAVTAQPVDTYVKPGVSKLDQLATALGQFQPELARFSGVLSDKLIKQAEEEGSAAANKYALEGKTYAEAVRNGDIPASESPWFMSALEEQAGRVDGYRFDSDLKIALAQDPNINSTLNMEDFDKFVTEFSKQWKEQNGGGGGRYNSAFDSMAVAAVETRHRPQFAKNLEGRVRKQASESAIAFQTAYLTKDAKDLQKEQRLEGLRQFREAQLLMGRSAQDVDADQLKAVGNAAIELRDFETLDLLKDLESAYGPSLSSTEQGSKYILKVEDEINQKLELAHKRLERQKKEEKEALLNDVNAEFIDVMVAAGPGERPNLKAIAMNPKYAAILPDVMDTLGKLQTKTNKLDTADDVLTSQMETRIWNPDGNPLTTGEILKAANGNLISWDQAASLTSKLKNWQLRMANLAEQMKKRGQDAKLHNDVMRMEGFKLGLAKISQLVPGTGETDAAYRQMYVTNQYADAVSKAISEGTLDPTDTTAFIAFNTDVLTKLGWPEKQEVSNGVTKENPLLQGKPVPKPASGGATGSGAPSGPASKGTTVNASGKSGGVDALNAIGDRKAQKAKQEELLKKYNGDRAAAIREYREWVRQQKGKQ